ncbi:hypothetical protein [Chitinophaga rhizophila]|uniref:Uncharacterized protein n=1 Tax=Chitinophaga rhizophila TaxID=2866212 RepID=A0ABS7GBK4_9BACT|nr:hypothetical protein [Chitinophaga rhizophila]MBW8685044.1 hypothetical protein [Chitinophaga rhizophila]
MTAQLPCIQPGIRNRQAHEMEYDTVKGQTGLYPGDRFAPQLVEDAYGCGGTFNAIIGVK